MYHFYDQHVRFATYENLLKLLCFHLSVKNFYRQAFFSHLCLLNMKTYARNQGIIRENQTP